MFSTGLLLCFFFAVFHRSRRFFLKCADGNPVSFFGQFFFTLGMLVLHGLPHRVVFFLCHSASMNNRCVASYNADTLIFRTKMQFVVEIWHNKTLTEKIYPNQYGQWSTHTPLHLRGLHSYPWKVPAN